MLCMSSWKSHSHTVMWFRVNTSDLFKWLFTFFRSFDCYALHFPSKAWILRNAFVFRSQHVTCTDVIREIRHYGLSEQFVFAREKYGRNRFGARTSTFRIWPSSNRVHSSHLASRSLLNGWMRVLCTNDQNATEQHDSAWLFLHRHLSWLFLICPKMGLISCCWSIPRYHCFSSSSVYMCTSYVYVIWVLSIAKNIYLCIWKRHSKKIKDKYESRTFLFTFDKKYGAMISIVPWTQSDP